MLKINHFIATTYIKKFLFIFMFLQIFFITLEIIFTYEKIPTSANLIILYIFYDFIFSMHIMFPISVSVASVVTMNYFVNSSEYVSFLALGYQKKEIIKPIFLTASFLTLFFVGLNSTKLAYAEEVKNSILDKNYINYSKEDIFIKHFNNYVFFHKLYLELKKVEDVRIFTFDENKNLLRIVNAKEAYFKDNKWNVKDATIIKNARVDDPYDSSLEILQHQEISTLDGFNPTMINNLYNKKNLSSILDAIKTLIVLREQGVDTKRHRIVIYQYGLIPWVSPAIILIIFFYLPYTPRIGRMALFSFFAIFSSVVTFGFFVSITEIAQKINVLPEIMIVLPVFLIMLIALYKYIKLV
jgi:lipopolysaccharide export system permease protein